MFVECERDLADADVGGLRQVEAERVWRHRVLRLHFVDFVS